MSTRYKADLRINEFDLNHELLKQPQKFYEYAYLAAQAKNDRDDLKDELDILENEIDAKVRSKPKKYIDDYDEDVPLREGAIKSIVKNHHKVKELRKQYMDARAKANLLDKAEKAFEQRKSMLNTYVYYATRNMNSNVRIPSEYQKEIDTENRKELKNELGVSFKLRRYKR